ncbi:MAG TPA: excisionase family DNA-binding protein [Candidatus Dormibacteraeota bacterium]|nr:excisionase family DNA-binding protein [Candidatus Dormibacteraeota bacterium]
MQPTTDEILTTGEASVLCGVSRSTLRRAVASGQVAAWHTPGKHLRFTRDACLDFARRLGRADAVDVVGRAHSGLPASGAAEAPRAFAELEAAHRG